MTIVRNFFDGSGRHAVVRIESKGLYENWYNIVESNGRNAENSSRAGYFASEAEAVAMMHKHRPAAKEAKKVAEVVKVEWCESFIRAQFTKHHAFPGPNAGIETNCFWDAAEASGLWTRGTYGTPMSYALENLTTVESVTRSVNGETIYCYSVFKMKPGV